MIEWRRKCRVSGEGRERVKEEEMQEESKTKPIKRGDGER